ncbi:MAG TPA: VOC family protein [Acidimicrobiales bacterium]|jgi:methylmalonyl-CoA/ethylmalonyl-CoA epimerase|nr:VOC family protein [Acidimicrobiales bacterium]
MPPETVVGVLLDHVAHAVHRWQDAWDRYAVDFGAEWSSGGMSLGFAPGQVRFANGARIELLMPHDTTANDFLERFLRSSGPGPHHLTFKVTDIAAAIEQARRSGLEPIGIDLSDPEWMEAFIHPKQATGVAVQLAQAATPWLSSPPADYPTDRRPRRDGSRLTAPASLLRVTHLVTDMSVATSIFVDLLGGETVGEGRSRGLAWIDLSWGGPLGLRLVAADGQVGEPRLLEWLDGRPGRIHHLHLCAEEPGSLPDAKPVGRDELAAVTEPDGTSWVVEPQANAGLRLVITDQTGE